MIPSPWFRFQQGLFLTMLTLSGTIFSACSILNEVIDDNPSASSTHQHSTATLTPFQPILDTQTPIPTDQTLPTTTPTFPPIQSPTPVIESSQNSMWIEAYLPKEFISRLNIPEEIKQAETPETSHVQLKVGDQQPVSHWVYALVGHVGVGKVVFQLFGQLRQKKSHKGAFLFLVELVVLAILVLRL